MGVLAKTGLGLTRWTERWIPDSWVIAVILTLVVALLALTAGGASPAMALAAWGNGMWALLTLGMQFTLMMVAGYACAVSPPVEKAFLWLASCPDPNRPRQAIILMALFATVTAWLNWAFSLVVTAAFLPFVIRANPRVDFRLLTACCYIGHGTVFHTGLSASAPLIIATPNNFLVQAGVLAETVPFTHTIFTQFNLVYAVAAGFTGIVVAAALSPPERETVTVSKAQAERFGSSKPRPERPHALSIAERLEWWPGWSLFVGVALLLNLFFQVRKLGFGRAWNIDSYNALLMALALLLHWRPKSFLLACSEGIRNTWGIVIQFPLYAGIFGLMTYTDLGKALTHFFVRASTPRAFPLVVYFYSTVLNFFVPSGGSKWIVEAPYLIPAAKALGISVGSVTMSYAYGDMTTHLIQPFWAIPILTVAGLRFGDIMGYGFVIASVMVIFNLVALSMLPLQL